MYDGLKTLSVRGLVRQARRSPAQNDPQLMDVASAFTSGSGRQIRVRQVGRGRAPEVVLACDDLHCDTALVWGLPEQDFDDGQSMSAFFGRLAARNALWPLHAVALAIRPVDVSDQRWRSDLLEEAFLRRQSLASPDPRPLLRRFVELGAETRESEARIADVSLASRLPDLNLKKSPAAAERQNITLEFSSDRGPGPEQSGFPLNHNVQGALSK